jgi:hypothetical protein
MSQLANKVLNQIIHQGSLDPKKIQQEDFTFGIIAMVFDTIKNSAEIYIMQSCEIMTIGISTRKKCEVRTCESK